MHAIAGTNKAGNVRITLTLRRVRANAVAVEKLSVLLMLNVYLQYLRDPTR